MRAFGSDLRRYLSTALRNRFIAFLAGVGVTALLQSSTATALMITSFAARGLVALAPALAVMLGANVGTTLIVQILSFDVSAAAPVLFLIGVIAFKIGKTTPPPRPGPRGHRSRPYASFPAYPDRRACSGREHSDGPGSAFGSHCRARAMCFDRRGADLGGPFECGGGAAGHATKPRWSALDKFFRINSSGDQVWEKRQRRSLNASSRLGKSSAMVGAARFLHGLPI